MKKIYMDHVATNPLHPDVLYAMLPYFRENFGNPLSIYEPGMKAREALETARSQTADLINAKAKEIIAEKKKIEESIKSTEQQLRDVITERDSLEADFDQKVDDKAYEEIMIAKKRLVAAADEKIN